MTVLKPFVCFLKRRGRDASTLCTATISKIRSEMGSFNWKKVLTVSTKQVRRAHQLSFPNFFFHYCPLTLWDGVRYWGDILLGVTRISWHNRRDYVWKKLFERPGAELVVNQRFRESQSTENIVDCRVKRRWVGKRRQQLVIGRATTKTRQAAATTRLIVIKQWSERKMGYFSNIPQKKR